MTDHHEAASDDAAVEELLFQALELFEQEGPAAVERLLAAAPQHAARVRAHLERLHRTGLAGGGAMPVASHPERLGEFRIVGALGQGGMGVVYRAVQESLGREVALKVIRPEQMFFPGARERFRREVELVARMQHPGIVPVHAVGSDDGVPYFAMELVRGASLADVIARLQGSDPARLTGADLDAAIAGVLGEAAAGEPHELFRGSWTEVVLRIGREVAEALEHAHRRSVLHRDVKPSNVMVTRQGRVLLFDFGLAGSDGGERLTRTGSALGSLAYMPPELLAGDPAARDVRSDVYSLGATLWELLALRLPYQGTDPVQLHRQALAAARPRLSSCNAAVGWEVETVVATALEPEPQRRYATAALLAQDLDNVLARRPIAARTASTWLRLRRWVQRHPARATAAVAAAVLLVGGPSLWAWQQSRSRALLQVERDKLAQANADLRAAKADAVAESERARRNFDQLQEAVDTMLTRVGDVSLRDVPRMGRVRSELLQEALRFYEDFLAEQPDDPRLLVEASRVRLRAAEVHGMLGEYEAAAAKFTRVLQDLGDRTGDVDLAIDIALAQYRLASTQRLGGDLDGAYASITAALQRWQANPAQDDRRVVHGLADARIEASYTFADRGDLEAALQVLQQSAAALAAWNAEHGDDAPLRHSEAHTLNRAAVYLQQLAMQQTDRARGAERVQQALELHRRAGAIYPPLLVRAPDNASLRTHAAENAVNSAVLLVGLRRLDEARPWFEQGVQWYAEVVRAHPFSQHTRNHLANARTNLAGLLAQQGELGAAGEQLAAARELYEELLEVAPESDAYRQGLCFALMTHSSLCIAGGEPAAALPLLAHAAPIVDALLVARPRQPVYRHMRRVGLGVEAEARIQTDDLVAATTAVEALLEPRLAPNPNALAAGLLLRIAAAHTDAAAATECRARARSVLQELVQQGVTLADLAADPMSRDQVGKDAFVQLWNELGGAER